MDEQATGRKSLKLNRRKFIGALGASAAAAAFLQRSGSVNAQSQTYYYQDSFGEIVPASLDTIALGIYPPPIASAILPAGGAAASPDTYTPGANNTTYYSAGYPKYNILLIIVDQMRNPGFWLPGGNSNGQNAVNSTIPNITQLANWSFSFPNYWVAATICGPSRACLLTGLYSQQTCQFRSSPAPIRNTETPPLLPYNPSWNNSSDPAGFPTIGNVLSQSIPIGSSSDNASYDCTWIGKWHLSCPTGSADGSIGQNGPKDYGFGDIYNIPNTPFATNPYPGANNLGLPSPNGYLNGGAGGDYLDSFTQGTPARNVPQFGYGASPPLPYNNGYPANNLTQPGDAAIAYAFTHLWLANANSNLNGGNANGYLSTPWFCAVSFLNPHDINDFPYTFGLSTAGNSYFGMPSPLPGQYFEPPPQNATQQTYYGTNCVGGNNNCVTDGDQVVIASSTGPYSALPIGTGNNGPWNWEDLTLAALQYGNNGKPGLQWAEKVLQDGVCGSIASPGTFTSGNWTNPTAWLTFLNYYMWMQACVDYQVGQVLGTNPTSGNTGLLNSPFSNNTVVIFTSDHGDYAGSHGLHSKGGALYEESLNVPLYVSYPEARAVNQSAPVRVPYVCSSVDLLPFLYTLVLGNEQWRGNNNDMIHYLSGRESIADAIYQYSNSNFGVLQERRISSVPLHTHLVGCNINNSSCPAWTLYQPFVLHTADDNSFAYLGGNSNNGPQPSHAIAFRTVDLTDPNTSPAPFAGIGHNTYGGGKLGLYGYWNTCNTTSAPIKPISPATNQYEFYNYSIHPSVGNLSANPQELGNQYFDANNTAGLSDQGQVYYNDFFNNSQSCLSTQGCINIQNELYNLNAGGSPGLPTQQVQAAIQTAFSNYISYLHCEGLLAGNNGTRVQGNNNSCPGDDSCTNCTSACNSNYTL